LKNHHDALGSHRVSQELRRAKNQLVFRKNELPGYPPGITRKLKQIASRFFKKNEMPTSSTVIMFFKKPAGLFTLHKVSVE
jgi:hypothetical protein